MRNLSITQCLSLRRLSKCKKHQIIIKNSGNVDSFVHTSNEIYPKYLQEAINKCHPGYEKEKIEFFKELYLIDPEKCEFILNHQHFGTMIQPIFYGLSFLKTIKNMTEKDLKQTFEEIENLYKKLPQELVENPETNEIYKATQIPHAINFAQLTILKGHNKEAYDYIINNPDKERISELLTNFSEDYNETVFETLTIPQIRQIMREGAIYKKLPQNEYQKILNDGVAAENEFIEYSDTFYQKPEKVKKLHEYLNLREISEPFTAYRAERDTGMFGSIILDDSMKMKLKYLALKNYFNTKKIKVHEYDGKFDHFNYTNLFSHIMKSENLTLADAMQMAKYGDKKFIEQITELIKSTSIKDSRFKSMTFDQGFASEWSITQDKNTKMLHNITLEKGLHGGCANENN